MESLCLAAFFFILFQSIVPTTLLKSSPCQCIQCKIKTKTNNKNPNQEQGEWKLDLVTETLCLMMDRFSPPRKAEKAKAHRFSLVDKKKTWWGNERTCFLITHNGGLGHKAKSAMELGSVRTQFVSQHHTSTANSQMYLPKHLELRLFCNHKNSCLFLRWMV